MGIFKTIDRLMNGPEVDATKVQARVTRETGGLVASLHWSDDDEANPCVFSSEGRMLGEVVRLAPHKFAAMYYGQRGVFETEDLAKRFVEELIADSLAHKIKCEEYGTVEY